MADRDRLWDAVPRGPENARVSSVIAQIAGVDHRSAGTKLDAMWKRGYGKLGLAFYHEQVGGASTNRLWWRQR